MYDDLAHPFDYKVCDDEIEEVCDDTHVSFSDVSDDTDSLILEIMFKLESLMLSIMFKLM